MLIELGKVGDETRFKRQKGRGWSVLVSTRQAGGLGVY